MGQLASNLLAHGDGRDEALLVLLPFLVVVPITLWRTRRKGRPPVDKSDTNAED